MKRSHVLLVAVVLAVSALPSASAGTHAGSLGLAQVACLGQAATNDEDSDYDYSKNCARGKALLGASDVVVSTDGRNVYAAAWEASSLVAYARTGSLGQLRQIGCFTSNGTSGIDGTKGSCVDGYVLSGAQHIAQSPDGRNLYVAAAGSGGIAVFTRDAATGKLTETACVRGIAGCVGARGLGGASDVVVSPDGLNVYLASWGSDAVVMFSRDSQTGALKGLGCISDDGTDRQCTTGNAMRGASNLVISKDGRWLYVSASDSNAVLTFERNAGTGLLAQRGCAMFRAPQPGSCTRVHGVESPAGLALAPDQRTLFVTGYAGTISVFARDRTTGVISERGCLSGSYDAPKSGCVKSSGLTEATDLAVSPDGRRLYVSTGSGMTVFDRDASTGGLVKAGCVAGRGYDDEDEVKKCVIAEGTVGASGVAVTPDGKNVYLTSGWGNSLSVFAPAASVDVTRMLAKRGALSVRISCPATSEAPCAGSLRLGTTSGHPVASAKRYTLHPGSARLMSLHFRVPTPSTKLLLRAVDRRPAVVPVLKRVYLGRAPSRSDR